MRPILVRLALIGAAIALVISCDSAPLTAPKIGTKKSSTTPDSTPPTVTIDTPLVGSLVNIGDSILVVARLHDNQALKNVTFEGFTVTGSVGLGTWKQTPRYGPVTAPPTGSFRPGLTDTVIRRYLQPLVPLDTTIDSLVIRAYAVDSAGNVDSASVAVNMVTGPKVTILTPAAGDSVPAGVAMTVSVRATHNVGVGRISIRVQGDATWPTPLDTTIVQAYATPPKDITFTTSVRIPANAPVKSRIGITASAIDVNRNPGSAPPITVFVRSSATAQPLVTQIVPTRMEIIDSITVSAIGNGIAYVGFIARDSVGNLVKRDSVALAQPYSSNVRTVVPVNLTTAQQGMRLSIVSFAIDQAGLVGYSTPAGTQTPIASETLAHSDSTLIVYGRTYQLPRTNTIGDIAVDAKRGNIFLSNTANNLLEVWQNGSKTFDPNGVAVGSQPWGLFVSNNPDTLLVANSGATTISRVYIGNATPSGDHEDLPHRIRTRNIYVFVIGFNRDPNTGKVKLTVSPPISYSDRPQYVAESKGGRIYYSTRPTAAATPGTVRWMDPALPVPDPRMIWEYGTVTVGTSITYALFNVDSVRIGAADPTTPVSDTLFIFDHPYGQLTGSIVVHDSIPTGALAKANAAGSDAEMVLGLDPASLALTDTTFVASSGDRSWLGFGEGNTKDHPGRIFMVNDPPGALPKLFSPVVTVSDLVENASEKVFGVAIDSTGLQVASHGLQSYFAAIDDPFHLRLSGTYSSFSNGAGIAFHPQANGFTGANATRVAFVASQTGQIQIVDVAYFINRGTLQLKNGLYGPLRASGPLPGDPANVVLKLFGLTLNGGLVVVDLTATDIKPGP